MFRLKRIIRIEYNKIKATIMCSFCQYSIIKKITKHLLTELKREKIIHCKTHHLIICYKISLIKTVTLTFEHKKHKNSNKELNITIRMKSL